MTTVSTVTARSEEDRARFRAISAVFRSWIAQDAAQIRSAKAALRDAQRRGSPGAPGEQSSLARLRTSARARLLAYGLHRDMPLERMERGRTGLDQLVPFQLPGMVRRAGERAAEDAGLRLEHPMAPAPDT
jgi:hypothetical protein